MKTNFVYMLILCAAFSVNASANNKTTRKTLGPALDLPAPANPMIIQAYKELYKRKPNVWELNGRNYNNGVWADYIVLRNYIKQYQINFKAQHLQTAVGISAKTGQSAIGFVLNNKLIGADIAADANGEIISEGGLKATNQKATIVIADDGRNYVITSDLPGVKFGIIKDMPKPGEKHLNTSGNGTLIVAAPVGTKQKRIAKK